MHRFCFCYIALWWWSVEKRPSKKRKEKRSERSCKAAFLFPTYYSNWMNEWANDQLKVILLDASAFLHNNLNKDWIGSVRVVRLTRDGNRQVWRIVGDHFLQYNFAVKTLYYVRHENVLNNRDRSIFLKLSLSICGETK